MATTSLTTFPGGSADIEEPNWGTLIPNEGAPKPKNNAPWREYAHREWLRVLAALRLAGTLAPENRHQMQRLVIAYVRYDMAAARAFASGMVITSPRGFPVASMWQAEMRAADQDATKCELELGIPPQRRKGTAKAKRAVETKHASDAYLTPVRKA